jgi:hypothetical protein
MFGEKLHHCNYNVRQFRGGLPQAEVEMVNNVYGSGRDGFDGAKIKITKAHKFI